MAAGFWGAGGGTGSDTPLRSENLDWRPPPAVSVIGVQQGKKDNGCAALRRRP